MLENFIAKEYEVLFILLEIIFFCWLIVGMSVFLDLYFGIKKSKQLGDITHSYGIRKTFEKLTFYYALMFLAFCGDAINPFGRFWDILSLPIITIVITFSLLYTEGLSICEKADQKHRRNVDASAKQLLDILLKNRELIEELKKKDKH